VGHLFLKRSGTLGRHFVSEEDDLGCSEDTLHWVDQDAVGLKSVEKCL
jgi:hypothetical protein